MTAGIDPSKTALKRSFMSRPTERVMQDGLLRSGMTFFDFGCGRGDDIRLLSALGYDANGWDPGHAPDVPLRASDVVNLGFVVNVIQDPHERIDTIKQAWKLAKSVLVVSARLKWDRSREPGKPHGDGVVTAAGTFQKYFEPDELRALVEQATGRAGFAATPDIVYVFRDAADAQKLLARSTRQTGLPRQTIAQVLVQQHVALFDDLRQFLDAQRRVPKASEVASSRELIQLFGSMDGAFAILRRSTGQEQWSDIETGNRSRRSEQRFAEHFDLLQSLIEFVEERGRLPRSGELYEEAEIESALGSVRRAFTLIRKTTPEHHWAAATDHAKSNFLVYVALAAFGGRPRLGDLPSELQHDAKDLFGSYRNACETADKLLFKIADLAAIDSACQASVVGKLTPSALYVHTTAVDHLDPLLRVYAGAAKVITGDVDDATILKLHRLKPQVSFLVYPRFDRDAHPALEASIVARLGQVRVTHRYFGDSDNPPILHRKDTFVPENYPGFEKFRRLSVAEENAGLLDRADIGRLEQWDSVLEQQGLRVVGHKLRRS